MVILEFLELNLTPKAHDIIYLIKYVKQYFALHTY